MSLLIWENYTYIAFALQKVPFCKDIKTHIIHILLNLPHIVSVSTPFHLVIFSDEYTLCEALQSVCYISHIQTQGFEQTYFYGRFYNDEREYNWDDLTVTIHPSNESHPDVDYNVTDDQLYPIYHQFRQIVISKDYHDSEESDEEYIVTPEEVLAELDSEINNLVYLHEADLLYLYSSSDSSSDSSDYSSDSSDYSSDSSLGDHSIQPTENK